LHYGRGLEFLARCITVRQWQLERHGKYKEMSILEKKHQLIDRLAIIEDVEERLGYIIDRGRKAPGLTDDFKIPAFKIEGCSSNLWMAPGYENGICHFRSDADAIITRGIAHLLCELYSGNPPEEIITLPPDFLAELGIKQHLSPNRSAGLANIWKKIKGYAEMHLASPSSTTQ